jgi:hypothetical protein
MELIDPIGSTPMSGIAGSDRCPALEELSFKGMDSLEWLKEGDLQSIIRAGAVSRPHFGHLA